MCFLLLFCFREAQLWQYTLLAGEEYNTVWRSCIQVFFKGDTIPSLFFSFTFFEQSCVSLPSMRTVQLFCVLFSPCVYSRASTVTYLIFVTVTKVYTYSIDVYIQYIIQKQCERRDSLCCTWLSLDCFFVCLLFLFSFILALDSTTVCLM